MKHLPLLMCTAFYGLYSMQAKAADKKDERPNILWLTFEDTSAYEFGCYGNNEVHTPNTDSLAACGIQFMNAWSVAPQSSAARSSLITGCYATTYGMDVHPVAYDTPADIFFPQKLREAGYYCTNNNKTHYNSTTDNKICWDECDNRASYNSIKRQKDQPFFAVFNTVTSHMGRIRTFHTDGRRDYTQEGIYPELLSLPSYVPDLPEMRSDYAGHLEAVQDVDTWLGFYLKDLKEKGLDENTIIFFFSDHGGCLPRGKGYLYESGLKVPLIAYFPPKWQHLANNMVGKETDLVNFTDLGPTVLSLAGVKPPKHMHGKALYGKFADKNKRDVQFALAANQLHHFMPVRAATDGRFKYIRSYIPYRQFALRNYYQWGMPSNKAWDKLVLGGQNTNPDWKQTFEAHSAEMLFDLEKDPDELHDLSGIPEYADVLAKMRRALSGHIRTTNDLGFFLPDSRTGHILYEKVRQEKYPLDDLYLLVETAGTATPASLPLLEKAIVSPLPEMRFWGVVGYAKLAREKQIKTCPQALLALLQDTNAYIASEAAYAVSYLGKADEGVARLVTPLLDKDRKIGYSSLECLSLDSEMRDYIRPFVPELKKAAETLPRLENEAAGLMARGILVNLGELKIEELHGLEVYQKGLKLNHGRRAMLPLPY
ncbi:sulfatase family protein [Bacteroides reticulotermitis]|nr:sulfatase [Bacteroides reticulotermitis]MBB4044175.1 arylsulfatase A-like enzyme [Bacteroides reticulotermitis]